MKTKKFIVLSSMVIVIVMALGAVITGCTSVLAIDTPANETIKTPTNSPVQTAPVVTNVSSGDVQNITSELTRRGYPEITVKKGIPVKWNIKVDSKNLNPCNNRIIISEFNIEKKLKAGDNIIEFTPTKDGTITYSCWMGMVTGRINIVSDAEVPGAPDSTAPSESQDTNSSDPTSGNCCAAANPTSKFADGKIPTDEISVAKVVKGVQEVTITIDDKGFTPAVAVVQKGIKTVIKFKSGKRSDCSGYIVFPEYNGALDLSNGEMETPELIPEQDFTFECSMSMLHGYIKVVDDITKINLDEIRKEIDNYTPSTNAGGDLAPSSGGASCH